jgi:type I restriction enzyme S subunit
MRVENNIPEGWVESTLNEIACINPRESIRKGDLAKNVPMDCIDSFTRKISRFGIKEFKGGSKFKNKDTLLARITPCLENGKTALVDILDKGEIGFGSTEYIVIRENNDKSHYKFLYYLSISPKFRRNAIKAMTGTSGRQRVQTDVLINKVFRFPPLPEQKAIAKVLTAFDDKIELLQAQNKTLETIAQTIFKEWFGKYQIGDELPEGWRVGKLGEIVTPIKGKNITKKQVIKGPYPVIAGGLKPSVFHNVCNTKSPVITVSASGANAGFVALHHHPVWSSDSTYIDVSFTDYFYFIYIFLKSNQSLIYDKQEGSAIPHVYPRHLENLNLIIPTRSEMGKYEELSVNIFHKLSNNESTIDTLSKTRDTLLPKLMSGQVRVNNIKNA